MQRQIQSLTKRQLYLIALSITSFLGFSVLVAGCGKVEPGYVGIKVNHYGSQRGVADYPIQTGRVWFNPFTEEIYKFPIFVQTVTWTKSHTEESPDDDSMTFNSIEGAIINADVSLAYFFEADKVPHLFVEFRRTPKEITWQYMRSKVRDALSRNASTLKVTEIFGAGKQKLLDGARADLTQELGPKGIRLDMLTFVGALRVDPKVEASINAVISATQRSVEAENKVRQTEAEARQRVAQAEGEAQSTLKLALAQAEANRKMAESITPELIQWQLIQKWNGTPPYLLSTGGKEISPLLALPAAVGK